MLRFVCLRATLAAMRVTWRVSLQVTTCLSALTDVAAPRLIILIMQPKLCLTHIHIVRPTLLAKPAS
jgi:hypothetical protein